MTLLEAPETILRAIADTGIIKPKYLALYGNAKLLGASKFYCEQQFLPMDAAALDVMETEVENGVLGAKILVSHIAGTEGQRAAIVPLRWGAPRILVVGCGMRAALGKDLKDEPFRAARLWRYQFDPSTDLVVSLSKTHDSGWIAKDNRVNRLVKAIALGDFS